MSRSAQNGSPIHDGPPADRSTAETAAILDLLGDEIARSILTRLHDGPKTARELLAACEWSRPTIYRRLSRLEDQGLVGSQVRLDSDGHHRKEFSTAIESVVFDLSDENFEAALCESPDSTSE